MAATIPFGKQYTDSHDLVKLLKSRGLSVEDDTKAQHYLEHIGYYRLSAFCKEISIFFCRKARIWDVLCVDCDRTSTFFLHNCKNEEKCKSFQEIQPKYFQIRRRCLLGL